MKKSELVDAVAAKAGLSKADASKAINAFADVVTEALQDGDKVTLNGVGSFSVKDRAARTGRNPRTGEATEIPAAKVPAFKASKTLKDALN